MDLVGTLRRYASLVWLCVAGATIFGLLSLREMPSGIHPEVEFPRVVAVAHVGDLPPEIVETSTTRPLEEAFATLPYLQKIRSHTIRGAVDFSIQFQPGIDTWRAQQLVESKVAEARGELPADAEIVVERVTATSVPVLTLNVSGVADGRVLREIALRIVRPALSGVPGIGQITVQGGDTREVEIVLRPDAVAAVHLSMTEIAERLSQSALVQAVGRAHDAHQVLTVVVASEPPDISGLAALPIAEGANGPLLLRDLADVFVGAKDRTVSVHGARGDVVVIMISRSPSGSAPEVAAASKRVIAGLRASHTLPEGIRIDTVYDQSALIDEALFGVRDAILMGIALSLVVLALFLRDARAGIAAALAVPITLVCTFGVMRLCGQTLNLMSLGGLAVAIGLVVDDAIVIVEAIIQKLERGRDVRTAASEGVGELFAPVVGTTLTTVVVFAPLPLISGVVGSFFGALAITLCAAVMLSLLVSLTVVPLTALAVLRPRPANDHVSNALSRRYGLLLRGVMRHRWLSLLAVGVFVAGGVFAARHVAVGFLPSMDEGAFVLDFFLPAGTSLEETDRVARGLDQILSQTPGVTRFTRRTGTEMGPAMATQQNTGDILVRLSPRAARRPIYEIMEDVRARVANQVPEARIEIIQILQDVLDDLSGSPSPVEVKIFGDDPKRLDALAHQVASRIGDMPELEDFWDGVEGAVPTLRAEVDPLAAQRIGVTPARVASDIEIALSGRVVSQARAGSYSIGVRVRGPDNVRFSPDALAALPIANGSLSVPLGAVASIARTLGPSAITHDGTSPVVIESAGIAPDADLSAVVAKVTSRLRGLRLPSGYRIELGGQHDNAIETQRALASVLGLGSLLVLAILLVQLRSLALAVVVLLSAPLAMLGAVMALVATATPLNASSMMGGVLLAGLVVKNGILLLERAVIEHAESGSFADAIVRAGERRIRPILMTTAATLAGLAPLALGLGAGAELQRPLAIAVLGGLTLSTLVSLIVVPAFASVVGPKPR